MNSRTLVVIFFLKLPDVISYEICKYVILGRKKERKKEEEEASEI